jgi:ribosomal protein S18 acetylase RimI-like enzyme
METGLMCVIAKEVLEPSILAAFDLANFDESHRMDEEEWRQMLSNGYVATYVARVKEEIAGILVLKTSSISTGLWYFYSVAVAEQFRRHRIAENLYATATEYEKVSGKINSHCHVDNAASIGLHKALGFKASQYVPDFYGDYEDAIMWEQSL